MTGQPDAVLDSMITWLDSQPDLSDGIDPRTWREVYDAGAVSADDVISAWLTSQARTEVSP